MHNLKAYVRNKAHPKGSIAKGYTEYENLKFSFMYFCGIQTRFNRPEQNYDRDQKNQMKHLFVLQLHNEGSVGVTEDLKMLSNGLEKLVTRYTACVINGIRFHSQDRNCKSINLYEVLKHIIKVSYLGHNRVFIFKCDFVDKSQLRGNYDLLELEIEKEDELDLDDPYQQKQLENIINIVEDNDDDMLCRNYIGMIDVDVNVEDQNDAIDNFIDDDSVVDNASFSYEGNEEDCIWSNNESDCGEDYISFNNESDET
ncbi:hypothetical protein ACOSQ3_004794 [Xanthoceras sorbifolium]